MQRFRLRSPLSSLFSLMLTPFDRVVLICTFEHKIEACGIHLHNVDAYPLWQACKSRPHGALPTAWKDRLDLRPEKWSKVTSSHAMPQPLKPFPKPCSLSAPLISIPFLYVTIPTSALPRHNLVFLSFSSSFVWPSSSSGKEKSYVHKGAQHFILAACTWSSTTKPLISVPGLMSNAVTISRYDACKRRWLTKCYQTFALPSWVLERGTSPHTSAEFFPGKKECTQEIDLHSAENCLIVKDSTENAWSWKIVKNPMPCANTNI